LRNFLLARGAFESRYVQQNVKSIADNTLGVQEEGGGIRQIFERHSWVSTLLLTCNMKMERTNTAEEERREFPEDSREPDINHSGGGSVEILGRDANVHLGSESFLDVTSSRSFLHRADSVPVNVASVCQIHCCRVYTFSLEADLETVVDLSCTLELPPLFRADAFSPLAESSCYILVNTENSIR
jgi:hypothetical protein